VPALVDCEEDCTALRTAASLPWLFRQLVRQLGSLLQSQIHSSFNRLSESITVETAESISVEKATILYCDRRHVNAELSRYLRAGQRVLGGAQFLSIAPDGAKVGNAYLLCPVVNNQSGKARWAPPQAPEEYLGEWALFGEQSECQELEASTLRRSTNFMKRRAGESVDVCRPKKRPRRKANLTMHSWDNIYQYLEPDAVSGLEQLVTTDPSTHKSRLLTNGSTYPSLQTRALALLLLYLFFNTALHS